VAQSPKYENPVNFITINLFEDQVEEVDGDEPEDEEEEAEEVCPFLSSFSFILL